MRKIDADALMGRLEKKRSETGNQRYTEGFNDALMRFRSMIHSAPTIDAEPVRHGRWEKRDGKTWCSLCGASNKAYEPPYCPHCGVKMDGGEACGTAQTQPNGKGCEIRITAAEAGKDEQTRI